jgi:hypothetical protein
MADYTPDATAERDKAMGVDSPTSGGIVSARLKGIPPHPRSRLGLKVACVADNCRDRRRLTGTSRSLLSTDQNHQMMRLRARVQAALSHLQACLTSRWRL